MASKTIVDIARAAGVSFKTVSRVINREPRVRKETRERVESVIAKLNYEPNPWARALRSSRTHLVGFICNSATPSYVNRAQASAMETCQSAGYHLLVEEIHKYKSDLKNFVPKFLDSVHLDGVVLLPPVSDYAAVMDGLERAKLPFVRISPYEDLARGLSVRVDDYSAAYRMTAYLRGLGHRAIAFIKGPASHAATHERLRGFLTAMADGGLAVDPSHVVSGAFSTPSGMAACEKLLKTQPRPTAIFASNDDMAIGVLAAAHRAGLAVPEDVSVAGFDDSPAASSVWPRLTTVRQPIPRLAQVATTMLIDRIESGEPKRPQELELKLVIRESAGAPAAAAKGGKRRGSARRRIRAA